MTRFRTLALLAVVALVGACGDSPSGPTPEVTPPTAGATLQVAIEGLPSGAPARVTVSGPEGFRRELTASQTLTNLAAGAYSVSADAVTIEGLEYGVGRAVEFVQATGGATTRIDVEYRAFNLRIEGVHITQAIQRFDGSIPLIAGRDGVLRVFLTANNVNTVAATVRARFFRGGEVIETLLIPSPGFAAPTTVNEASVSNSWNVMVPGALLQPGISLAVDIDPESRIREGSRSDNAFPSSGGSAPLDVRAVPPLDLVLVPIQQGDGTIGNVTEANKGEYVADLMRMFPIGEMRVTVRAPYVTGTRLRPEEGWVSLLSELEAVRLGDGSRGQYYYGVARINYQSGTYGIAYRPGWTGLGNDYLDTRNLNASMTLAHEMGHSMNRPHSQCGAVSGLDPNYPHPNGQIGSHGFDVRAMRIFEPGTRDLMGYCENRWIGDHTYLRVLDHRLTAEPNAGAARGAAEPSLVVWGRVEDGRVVLEPAFEAQTRATLPERPGPYTLEGLDADGRRIFALSFAASPVEHAGPDDAIFAFAVPNRLAQHDRLASLRVVASGREVARRSASMAAEPRLRRGVDGRTGAARLEWDAATHPLVVLRDPATGRILSLARGGTAAVDRLSGPVEAVVSDGVRSRRVPGAFR